MATGADRPSPRFARVTQAYDRTVVADVRAAVHAELGALGLDLGGKSVALTAGSRGVANIVAVLAATTEWVRAGGGSPFVVPAMGSHGGATAEGQLELLHGYGITEEAVGCEIRSSMEVVELPQGACPVKCHMDKHAYEADATIVINRVKPHTDFRGTWESGLMKMVTIGLGKRQGAEAVHDAVNKREGVKGLAEYLPVVARQKLAHGNIVCGLALVENAYDETRLVKAMLAADIPEVEKTLLALARENMPTLPAEQLDVLVIDEMGKNISGVGMDTNIIGRMYQFGTPEPPSPRVASICVHSITPESHGNATGMGLADCVPRRFFEAVDFEATATNIITSNNLERGKLPCVCGNDEHTWSVAVRASGCLSFGPVSDVRAIRIVNTLQVEEGLSLLTADGDLAPFGGVGHTKL